jgi:hypothetical protein
MNYARNYLNSRSLAATIREAAAAGNKAKPAGGLASREERRQNFLKEPDFGEIRATYMNMVQDMFRQRIQDRIDSTEDTGFADELTGPSVTREAIGPKRNPRYWASSPLLSDISVDVTEENIRNILNTIKAKESGGDYSVKNPKASASGAYQFINSTWQTLTNKYGIGTEFTAAMDAPPEVQDRVAAAYVRDILSQNNNDVAKVPLVWYTGNAAGELSQEAIDLNNGLTPAEYQFNWLRDYSKFSGGQE